MKGRMLKMLGLVLSLVMMITLAPIYSFAKENIFVSNVDLTDVVAPVVGQMPNYSVGVADVSTQVTGVTWYRVDKNGKLKHIGNGEKFKKDTSYVVYVNVNCSDGYSFSRDGNVNVSGAGSSNWSYAIDCSGMVCYKYFSAVESSPSDPETPDKPTPDKPTPDKPTPDKPTPDKPNPDKPNPDKPNPDKPNPDKPNPDKPNPDKPNPDKPNPDKPNPDKPNPGEDVDPTNPVNPGQDEDVDPTNPVNPGQDEDVDPTDPVDPDKDEKGTDTDAEKQDDDKKGTPTDADDQNNNQNNGQNKETDASKNVDNNDDGVIGCNELISSDDLKRDNQIEDKKEAKQPVAPAAVITPADKATVASSTATKQTQNVNAVKTGDNTLVIPVMSVCILSACGIAYLYFKKRKEQ